MTRALGRLDAWRAPWPRAWPPCPIPASVTTLAELLDQPLALVAAAVGRAAGAGSGLGRRGPGCTWSGRRARRSSLTPAGWPRRRPARCPTPRSTRRWSGADLRPAPCWIGCSGHPPARCATPTGPCRRHRRSRRDSPVDELSALDLLRPLDADTVILPREVAWRLRGGRLRREPVVDHAAARSPAGPGTGSSSTGPPRARPSACWTTSSCWSRAWTAPPSGRCGPAGCPPATSRCWPAGWTPSSAHATFLLECAYAARLVALGPAAWPPTTAYDVWLAEPAPRRWRRGRRGVADAPRFFARSAAAGAHALGPEAESPAAADLRGALLAAVRRGRAGNRRRPGRPGRRPGLVPTAARRDLVRRGAR